MPIRTGLGTMAVLVGSVLAVAGLRNFSCVKLGTMKNLQVLLAFFMSAPATSVYKIGVDMI